MKTVVVLAVLLSAGCGKDEGGARCVPGKSEPCSCVGGGTGSQRCLADGTYEDCSCTAGNPDRGVGGRQDSGVGGDQQVVVDVGITPDRATAPPCSCNITAACQDQCDCDPDCTIVDPFYCQARTSSCWDSCGDQFGSCLTQCGAGNGIDCWHDCGPSGVDYCVGRCGTEACAGVLCWATCTGITVKACAQKCGISNQVCGQCQPKTSAQTLCAATCDTKVYGVLGCKKMCGV